MILKVVLSKCFITVSALLNLMRFVFVVKFLFFVLIFFVFVLKFLFFFCAEVLFLFLC